MLSTVTRPPCASTSMTAEFDVTHRDHSLRFDRLQFSLGGKQPVLANVHLGVAANETVALIGVE